MRYKKFVSLLLSFCLILSLVPLSLSAEGPPTPLGSIEAGEVDFNDPGDTVQPMYYDDGYLYVNPGADYIKVGSTLTIYYELNNAYLEEFFSSNTAVATVSNSGVITAHSPGSAIISVSAYDTVSDGYHGYSFRVMVYDSFALQSSENYYIYSHNGGHQLLARNASGAVPIATTLASESELADGVTNDYWQLLQHSDGKYSIRFGTNALTLSGTNLVLSEYTGSYYQKFTIYRISDVNHAHHGGFVIRYGNFYVGLKSLNQLKLIAHTPGTSNVTDGGYFWSFIEKDRGTATIEGFSYSGYNTTSNFSRFNTVFSQAGYTVTTATNPTPTQTYDAIQSSEVFLYHGHGLYAAIFHYNSSGSKTGLVGAHNERYTGESGVKKYINLLPENQLSSTRAVFYMACLAGASNSVPNDDGTYANLVDETYEKGAHFVMGPTLYINSGDNSKWIRHFLVALGYLTDELGEDPIIYEKRNIQDAIIYANDMCNIQAHADPDDPYTTYDEYPLYMRGNKFQYLGAPM